MAIPSALLDLPGDIIPQGLAAAGVDAVDDGFVDLSATDADAFVAKLAALRFWERDVTA